MHAQTLLVLLLKKSTALAAELAFLLRHGKWLICHQKPLSLPPTAPLSAIGIFSIPKGPGIG
jgi:hypothetical protein